MRPPARSDDEALRIRYLDWCSVQVLQRIAELPPEAMWLLDQASQPQEPGSDRAPVDQRLLPRIRRIALHLFRTLDLPDFETWKDSLEEADLLAAPSSPGAGPE